MVQRPADAPLIAGRLCTRTRLYGHVDGVSLMLYLNPGHPK